MNPVIRSGKPPGRLKSPSSTSGRGNCPSQCRIRRNWAMPARHERQVRRGDGDRTVATTAAHDGARGSSGTFKNRGLPFDPGTSGGKPIRSCVVDRRMPTGDLEPAHQRNPVQRPEGPVRQTCRHPSRCVGRVEVAPVAGVPRTVGTKRQWSATHRLGREPRLIHMFRPRLVDVHLLHAENVHVHPATAAVRASTDGAGSCWSGRAPTTGCPWRRLEGSHPHKARRYPAEVPTRTTRAGLLITVLPV